MNNGKKSNIVEGQNSFNEVLCLIDEVKHKVYRQANKVLIELYLSVGHYVSNKIIHEAWGKSTVEELSDYIGKYDPNIKGFSKQNILRMKQFYETYKDNEKLSPLVREVSWTNNLASLRDLSKKWFAFSRMDVGSLGILK